MEVIIQLMEFAIDVWFEVAALGVAVFAFVMAVRMTRIGL